MPRYVIEYKGGSIELPVGDTIVGRGLACRIRFNDPAVSRRHLVLRVTSEAISAEDLSGTNRARLNGTTMPEGSCPLGSNDVVELGNTWFRVSTVAEEDVEEQTFPGDGEADAHRPRSAPSEYAASSAQRESDGPLSNAIAATSEAISTRLDSRIPLPKLESQTCPRCRAKVPISTDDCPSCGYQWPTGRPQSVTQPIDIQAVKARLREADQPERRVHPRVVVDMPVIYDSEALTFDATCRDISFGGLFVHTELLDDIGTPCTVTVLPDGGPAMAFKGVVCRVVKERAGALVPGMAVRFDRIGVEARVWLSSLFRPD